MEDSLIYDLLESCFLQGIRKKLKQQNDNTFSLWVNEAREKLKNEFNEIQLELIDNYVRSVIMREENIELEMNIKILNYGIKIGTQIQEVLNEDN